MCFLEVQASEKHREPPSDGDGGSGTAGGAGVSSSLSAA